MATTVSYRITRLRFFTQGDNVVGVEQPAKERLDEFDFEAAMLPVPCGYSSKKGARIWELTLCVDVSTHTRGPFRDEGTTIKRVYPQPWSLAWRKTLDRALRAEDLLRGWGTDSAKQQLARLSGAIDLVYSDIAAKAYAAWLVMHRGETSEADTDLDLYLETVTADQTTSPKGDDGALTHVIGPFVAEIFVMLGDPPGV